MTSPLREKLPSTFENYISQIWLNTGSQPVHEKGLVAALLFLNTGIALV